MRICELKIKKVTQKGLFFGVTFYKGSKNDLKVKVNEF